MAEQLTDKELGTIFMLVRREAIAKGYGGKYSEYNRHVWPHRLKHLSGIARKIHAMRGNTDGIP